MGDRRTDAIQAFAGEFADTLSKETLYDVVDWCDHREWPLGLEVLADKLFEAGAKLDDDHRETLAGLVELCGADPSRFDFLLVPSDT